MSLTIEALKEPTAWDYVHPKESHFTAEDVEKITAIGKISQTTLGLRHISSRERAIKESTEGMRYGCSLNISFGESVESFEFDFPFKDFNKKIERADMPLRIKLLADYEKAIDQFIRTSIQMDTPRLTLDSKVQDLLASAEKTSFVLLKYPNFKWGPSDIRHGAYGGLGRHPGLLIPPKDVVLLPFVDINVPESERQKKIGSYGNYINIENFLIATYRTVLIDYLRDKDVTFWKRDLAETKIG